MVAWKVRSGVAGTARCEILNASRAASADTAPPAPSMASTRHSSAVALIGAVTSQNTSRVSPAARSTSRVSSVGSFFGVGGFDSTLAESVAWRLRSDALRTVTVIAAGVRQAEGDGAGTALGGIEKQKAQVARGKRLAIVQNRLSFLAGDEADAYFFVHARGDAVNVGGDGLAFCRRVQAQHEDLVFVDLAAFERQTADHRRTAGAESESLSALKRLAVESRNPGFEREAAAHAGGQVAIEVVHPVLAVGPAAFAFFDAIDIERVELARVAERHHCRREARGRLSHAFHFALRRKEFDRLRAERGHPRGTERHAYLQGPDFHASSLMSGGDQTLSDSITAGQCGGC